MLKMQSLYGLITSFFPRFGMSIFFTCSTSGPPAFSTKTASIKMNAFVETFGTTETFFKFFETRMTRQFLPAGKKDTASKFTAKFLICVILNFIAINALQPVRNRRRFLFFRLRYTHRAHRKIVDCEYFHVFLRGDFGSAVRSFEGLQADMCSFPALALILTENLECRNLQTELFD